MHRITFILLAVAFISCNKDYNCQCTPSTKGYAGFHTGPSLYSYNASSKKKAKTICEQHETEVRISDSTRSCDLQ